MNIWAICQYAKPEPGAPSARLGGFADMWQKNGANVTLLTSVPNHPKGKPMPSYEKAPSYQIEVAPEGYRVARHRFFMSANEGFIKKTLMHLDFAWQLLRRHYLGTDLDKPDVIMASSPSFFAVISAWLLAKKYRVPFVFEVRDLWPGIFRELGTLKNEFWLGLLEKIELFLYRRAAAVVPVTKGFAKDIAARGIAADKIYVITNGVHDAEFAAATSAEVSAAAKKLKSDLQLHSLTKVLLYIGTHGGSQALGQIIDAARTMMHRSDVLFLFVGAGADKARLEKLARGMPNVQFKDAVGKSAVAAYYAMAYGAFVPLKDTPGFNTFIPSKMFEILAAETPVIGCVRGEAADILTQSGGAIVVPPEKPEQLVDALNEFIDHDAKTTKMGPKGRAFVGEHYIHSKLASQYLSVFKKVIEHHRA